MDDDGFLAFRPLSEQLRSASPDEVAELIGGTVEEGSTPTTQGMVRVVGPWVPKAGA